MSVVTALVGFGLRQVIGEGTGNVAGAVEQRLRDHSQTLPRALGRAHERAWQALGLALAGEGLLDRVKVFFASGDDKGVREQVAAFLQANAASFSGTPDQLRRACLEELKRLRKSGLLSCQGLPAADIARQAAGFQRYTDPQGLVEGAIQAVKLVADALREGYPNLSRLLHTPTPAGPPLLAAAFSYFFRREVETDDELAHGLFFDGLRQLAGSQAKAFAEVNRALATLGEQFDALFEQLGRIEVAVIETRTTAAATHAAVLDLKAEWQRLGGLPLANAEEFRTLLVQVQQHLGRTGMHQGEVRPQHSFSIRGEDERRAVRALLERFRRLPQDEQRQVPALLNGLGKLEVGAGDFAGATRTFNQVVQAVADPAGKAEAFFNSYRAALEQRDWDAALGAIRQAASLDPQRFAPFPLHRYEPRRILGAGGFGTAVLCHDRHFDEEVVVKTLHAADLERGVDEVFREARTLRRLSHPAIIGVRDCEYADPAAKARPYLVMDYFPGDTLEQFIERRGTLTPEQWLQVAGLMAEGMQAAHGQGVLHRDLKPANVLVREEGNRWEVKIIDFGLALRRQAIETSLAARSAGHTILSESVAGTLKYAPPEQVGEIRGVRPGPYSDVFSFGKTCCFALFRTTEPRSRHLSGLPADLRELLEKCIEQELEHRHPSFEPVLAVLKALDSAQQETERRREEDQRRQREEQARQQRELEERQVTNLRRLEESGRLHTWVAARVQGWDPAGRLALLQELEQSEFWPLALDRLAVLLEAIKREKLEAHRKAEAERRQQQREEAARRQQEEQEDEGGFDEGEDLGEVDLPDPEKHAEAVASEVADCRQQEQPKQSPECVVIQACPQCDQKLRVPRDRGSLIVTCPTCRHAWSWDPLEEVPAIDRAASEGPEQPSDLTDSSPGSEARRCLERAKNSWDINRELAIQEADEAIRLAATVAEGYEWRGHAHFECGNYLMAIDDWEEAIKLDPTLSQALTPRLAAAFADQAVEGDLDEAIQFYSEAIRLDPTRSQEWLPLLAECYAERGLDDHKDFDEAIVDLREAIRLDPRQADRCQESLVDAYFRNAEDCCNEYEYDEATVSLNAALALDPALAEDEEFRRLLQRAANQGGDSDEEDGVADEEDDVANDDPPPSSPVEALDNAAVALDAYDLDDANDWLDRYCQNYDDDDEMRKDTRNYRRYKRLRATLNAELNKDYNDDVVFDAND